MSTSMAGLNRTRQQAQIVLLLCTVAVKLLRVRIVSYRLVAARPAPRSQQTAQILAAASALLPARRHRSPREAPDAPSLWQCHSQNPVSHNANVSSKQLLCLGKFNRSRRQVSIRRDKRLSHFQQRRHLNPTATDREDEIAPAVCLQHLLSNP
jgi:hypothetical protein